MKQSPSEALVQDQIRGLEAVVADKAFEVRLQQAFVSGALADQASTEASVRTSSRSTQWMALAAAASLLVLVGIFLNGGQRWVLEPISDQGVITVRGSAYSTADTEALTAAISSGVLVETDAQARIELEISKFLAIEVLPGSRLMAPTAPGRWWGRTVECGVMFGEARLMTGPRFPGAALTVTTPEVLVEVNGTTIAVNRDEGGTCVCVLNGTARIGTGPDDMEEVPSGMRKVVLTDGTPPFITEIKPMHMQGILELEARHPELK